MKEENKKLSIKLGIFLFLCVFPFWLGRELAVPYALKNFFVNDNGLVIAGSIPDNLILLNLFGILIVYLAASFFIGSIVEHKIPFSQFYASLFFSFFIFLCGFGFLRDGFYQRTEIIFSNASSKINAIDIGLIEGFAGLVIFVILYIVAMIFLDDNLNHFFRTRPSIIILLAVELLTFALFKFTPLESLVYFL